MRRALLAVLLVLAALPAAAAAQEPRTSMPDVEDEVMCVSCKVPLNIAESTQANRERALIQTLVDRGLTKDEIKDRLVAEYGANVLAMPDDDGVGLAAYLVPVAVVLALLGVVAVLIPRWRRRGPQPSSAADDEAPIGSDEEIGRLDDELARAR